MASNDPLLPVTAPGQEHASVAEIVASKKGHAILSGKSFKNRLRVDQSASDSNALPYRRDILKIEKEAVLKTSKPILIQGLCLSLEPQVAEDFKTLSRRVESTIRAWYKKTFSEASHLYQIFEPLLGNERIKEHKISEEQLEVLEKRFFDVLFFIFSKSNYKLVTDSEQAVALEGTYKLSLPVEVDDSKLDGKMLPTYFSKVDVPNKPTFANNYLIFRRGVGLDVTTDKFLIEKVDMVLSSIFNTILVLLCLKKRKSWETVIHDTRTPEEQATMSPDQILSVGRIHLENMKLSFKFLTSLTTIQEPTFERVIVLHRPATPPDFPYPFGDRTIVLKHFRHIPMADMEVVMPEKKTPGLTPRDVMLFIVTILLGCLAVIKAQKSPKVLLTVLVAGVSYIAKLFFAWRNAMKNYSVLLQQSMYDKQLDSGIGTLLHLCDDVLDQEFKETMVAYFILLTTGSATQEELDKRCELFMEEKFEEDVQFEVNDAIDKLVRLGLAKQGSDGKYSCIPVHTAATKIGKTTDEMFGAETMVERDDSDDNSLFHF